MEVEPKLQVIAKENPRSDWHQHTLSNITVEIGDGIHSTPRYSSTDAYHFVNGNNLREGRIVITEETKSVDESEFKAHRKNLNCGSILMSINGTIGNLALFRGEKLVLGKSAAYINVKPEIDRLYVYYALQIEQTRRQFFDSLTGSTIGNLSLAAIRNTNISVPPTKAEQEAIAGALSDADALIESLEQLLTKKRHIKQGAMQELLTGKKRLRGFNGDWKVKRLGDILTIAHGKSQHAVEDRNGTFPILASGGQIGTAKQFLYDKPSVLIGRKGTIDQPQFMDKPFWTVDTLFYSIVFEPNNAKFLYFRFCLINWRRHNEASGVPSLNAKTIERIEINLPEENEQTAIATILSDMDAEISALETKLAKAKTLKQGMMQELLTGRIRLI